MNSKFVEFKTVDNTKVRFQKSNIAAVEEIPASARSEGYVKIFVAGFAFSVRLTLEEVMKAIAQ